MSSSGNADEREPAVSGEDGLFALDMTLAAYASAASGQPETLP